MFEWDFILPREITASFLTASKKKKKINTGMHLYIYVPIWFKRGVVIDTTEIYILIPVCVTSTLIQGHGDARKENKAVPIISQSYEWIWLEFGMLLRLVCLINPMLIWSHLINIQRRESKLGDFVKNTLTLACIQTFKADFFEAWCDDRHH